MYMYIRGLPRGRRARPAHPAQLPVPRPSGVCVCVRACVCVCVCVKTHTHLVSSAAPRLRRLRGFSRLDGGTRSPTVDIIMIIMIIMIIIMIIRCRRDPRQLTTADAPNPRPPLSRCGVLEIRSVLTCAQDVGSKFGRRQASPKH